MASQGIRLWTWTVDTNDWRGKSRTQVVSYVIGNSAQGSTVLMHMNHAAFNAQSIREMKSGLNRRGLQVCSINAGRQVAKAGGRIPDRLAC
jgi:peptidoglycan/xylan/chitin deacetylase (PgdA/CDA1 family)